MKEIILGMAFGFGLGSLMYGVANIVPTPEAVADRYSQSCECRELKLIRKLLEKQNGVICDEFGCLPMPTPTAPNGGELP